MKIYDKDLINILSEEEIDFKKGYLEKVKKENFIKEIPYTEEQGHFEIIKEYENGGRDMQWIIDQPRVDFVPAHVEYELVYKYIPYSKEELEDIKKDEWLKEKRKKIEILKKLLLDTDFRAIKYAEGCYSEAEYAPWRSLRQDVRDEINLIGSLEYETDYDKLKDF